MSLYNGPYNGQTLNTGCNDRDLWKVKSRCVYIYQERTSPCIYQNGLCVRSKFGSMYLTIIDVTIMNMETPKLF